MHACGSAHGKVRQREHEHEHEPVATSPETKPTGSHALQAAPFKWHLDRRSASCVACVARVACVACVARVAVREDMVVVVVVGCGPSVRL